MHSYNNVTHVYSRGRTEKGNVVAIRTRYCAACGKTGTCLKVMWPDNPQHTPTHAAKYTLPCVCGLRFVNENEMEIV